jgi:hypothetical protein
VLSQWLFDWLNEFSRFESSLSIATQISGYSFWDKWLEGSVPHLGWFQSDSPRVLALEHGAFVPEFLSACSIKQARSYESEH